MGLSMLLSGTISLGQLKPFLVCIRPSPSLLQMHQFLVTFQVISVLTDVICLSTSNRSVVLGENLLKKLIISKNAWSSFLFLGGISGIALSFYGSVLHNA